MNQTIFKGEFEVLRVTPDLYEPTLELLSEVFVNHEHVCKATKMKDSPEAIAELHTLIRKVLSYGISFAMRHLQSGRIVAASANAIFNHKRPCSYDDVVAKFRTPTMLKIYEYWSHFENIFNIYKEWQVDSIGEVEFLGTHPDFMQRGLAVEVSIHSIEFIRQMSKGKVPPEVLAQLSEEMQIEKPEAVVTVPSSLLSQKCCQKLGLQVIAKVPLSKFSFEGKTFDEIIGCDPQDCTEIHAIRI